MPTRDIIKKLKPSNQPATKPAHSGSPAQLPKPGKGSLS